MNGKILSLLVLVLGLHACSARRRGKVMVLSHRDFAPQAICHELIGPGWYQWESTGGPDPGTVFDIRLPAQGSEASREGYSER